MKTIVSNEHVSYDGYNELNPINWDHVQILVSPDPSGGALYLTTGKHDNATFECFVLGEGRLLSSPLAKLIKSNDFQLFNGVLSMSNETNPGTLLKQVYSEENKFMVPIGSQFIVCWLSDSNETKFVKPNNSELDIITYQVTNHSCLFGLVNTIGESGRRDLKWKVVKVNQ